MSEPVTVGDLVTPENVAGLPVGTIVRWTWPEDDENAPGAPACAVKVGPLWWIAGVHLGLACGDDIIAEGGGAPPAFIAYLPEGT